MNNLISIVFVLIYFYIFQICTTQALICERRNTSGSLRVRQTTKSGEGAVSCWILEVPEGSYARLQLKDISLASCPCSSMYVEISVPKMREAYKFCDGEKNIKPITAVADVNITHSHFGVSRYSYDQTSSFTVDYVIESIICTSESHFRCSNSTCIHQSRVCDGVKDCENGADEIGCKEDDINMPITEIGGVDDSRINATSWLKSQRSASFGWGKNTHRAITALYLAKAAAFNGINLEEELMVKQLELQTSVALLRNSSDPISVSELSMFVNALTVTCHNPRKFFGYDLLQILGDQVSALTSPSAGAYLTLCNYNLTLSESDVRRLLKPLEPHSKYLFILDIQAMSILALTCIKKNKNTQITDQGLRFDVSHFYNKTIKNFIASQLSDGSFGNTYTTALVTQALISSGQENNKEWNVTATAEYLMNQLNSSSVDFLSVYYALPIFAGQSLVDISAVDCRNITRKLGEDDISDVTNKLGGKMRIQYSLYVGDQKDVIHTMFLRMPENSTAYDVMRMAQVADSKYKFLYRGASGQIYVYDIAGITNDPEGGKFWLLYTEDHKSRGILKHHTESPDKFVLVDGEHLIMWFKTVDI